MSSTRHEHQVPARGVSRGRKRVVWVTTLGLMVGGGVAYAYWTTTGTGVGSAVTGTAQAVVAKQTSTVSSMGPGVAAQTLSGNFDNPNPGPVYVGSVAAAIASITYSGGAPATGCTTADYDLLGSPVTVNANVPAGNNQGSWTGATIAFKNDPARNQDACKNAIVNLTYTVS